MFLISPKRQNYLLVSAFIALSFIFWKTSANFFWKDEMSALKEMMTPSLHYFIEPINGQIVPLFKVFYFLELNAFGVNTMLFLYVNLILFGCTMFIICKLMHANVNSLLVCLTICSLSLVHPVNYNHLLWTFQVGETLQFLFQALSIFYLMKFIKSSLDVNFFYAVLFLILQNYFFGNGVFFPLLFVVAFILFPIPKKTRYILASSCLLITFIAIQLLWGKSVNVTEGLITRIPAILNAFIYFTGVNLARFFFITEKIYTNYIIGISTLIFVLLLIIGFSNKKTNKKILLFYLAWFILTSISVPIARGNLLKHIQIPHYYSVLSFIPFTLLLTEIVSPLFKINLNNKLARYLTLSSIGACLLLFFIIDNKMTNTYTIRSVRNEANMNKAINQNSPYYGFDDPHFCDKEHPREDGFYEYMFENPKEVYLYWKARTAINLNSNLENE